MDIVKWLIWSLYVLGLNFHYINNHRHLRRFWRPYHINVALYYTSWYKVPTWFSFRPNSHLIKLTSSPSFISLSEICLIAHDLENKNTKYTLYCAILRQFDWNAIILWHKISRNVREFNICSIARDRYINHTITPYRINQSIQFR